MPCDRADTVLHGYFDSELDVLGAAEFEQCSDCVNALEALESLRSSINLAQLYEKAPAPFRKKILAGIGSARPVAVFPARTVWRWLAVPAAFLLVSYPTQAGKWLQFTVATRNSAQRRGCRCAFEIAATRSSYRRRLLRSTHRKTLVRW